MPSKVNAAGAGQRPASLAQNPMLVACCSFICFNAFYFFAYNTNVQAIVQVVQTMRIKLLLE